MHKKKKKNSRGSWWNIAKRIITNHLPVFPLKYINSKLLWLIRNTVALHKNTSSRLHVSRKLLFWRFSKFLEELWGGAFLKINVFNYSWTTLWTTIAREALLRKYHFTFLIFWETNLITSFFKICFIYFTLSQTSIKY